MRLVGFYCKNISQSVVLVMSKSTAVLTAISNKNESCCLVIEILQKLLMVFEFHYFFFYSTVYGHSQTCSIHVLILCSEHFHFMFVQYSWSGRALSVIYLIFSPWTEGVGQEETFKF